MIIHKERRGVEEYFSSKIRENGCCFFGKKVEYRSGQRNRANWFCMREILVKLERVGICTEM